jgi:hypothetical protein
MNAILAIEGSQTAKTIQPMKLRYERTDELEASQFLDLIILVPCRPSETAPPVKFVQSPSSFRRKRHHVEYGFYAVSLLIASQSAQYVARRRRLEVEVWHTGSGHGGFEGCLCLPPKVQIDLEIGG